MDRRHFLATPLVALPTTRVQSTSSARALMKVGTQHGHTDAIGRADANRRLSEARAFAVRDWLERQSPTNFTDARVRVFAHGSDKPVASNETEAGRDRNRRVEIVLGTVG